MKFSLFYPIFQKIWPYEMPYFLVKRHLKPFIPVKEKCSRYAFKSNLENSPNNLLNKHIQYTGLRILR